MTYKEWNAAVMVASALAISGWVVYGIADGGFAADPIEAARRMLWAVGYVIAFNVVAMILISIAVGIAQREALADEAEDERDRAVNARAMRNGYMTLSIGVLLVLIAQAVGIDAALVPYALFGVSMLAGGIFAASQLVYYRIG